MLNTTYLNAPIIKIREAIKDTFGWNIFKYESDELLYRCIHLNEEENTHLFEQVQFFIELTKKVYFTKIKTKKT